MPKIGIFIPCYNVQRAIEGALRSFPDDVLREVDRVVVTDNCSQDDTLKILRRIQAAGGEIGRRLVIIRNSQNYGLGGSQKIAYQYFLDNGFTHFFVVHGDGQGDGGKIAQGFLDVFHRQPNIDLILTSRFMKGSRTEGYNALRVFGNHVFNVLTFFCTGHWMTDSGAAIIFARTRILDRVPFWELTNSFQFNPELNILLHNLGDLKVAEVPLCWSDSKDKSNISPLNYCLKLLGILLRYRWNKTILRKDGARLLHSGDQKIAPSFEIFLPSA
jgi:glycosyltransferase involved in cell wall biosynthesis